MKMRDFNVNQESHVDGGEILMRKLSGSLRGVEVHIEFRFVDTEMENESGNWY